MKDISFIINHLEEERGKYFNSITPPVFQTSNFAFNSLISDLDQDFTKIM